MIVVIWLYVRAGVHINTCHAGEVQDSRGIIFKVLTKSVEYCVCIHGTISVIMVSKQ